MTRTTRTFIDAGEVADLLGLTDRFAFLHRRERLMRDDGFPPPMPHSARPLLWRRSQVEAWIDAFGRTGTAPVATVEPGGNVHLMREARRA